MRGARGCMRVHEGHTRVHAGHTIVHEGRMRVHEGCTRVHEGHTRVHEGHTRVHEGHTIVHEGRTRVHEGRTRVHEGRTRVPCSPAPTYLPKCSSPSSSSMRGPWANHTWATLGGQLGHRTALTVQDLMVYPMCATAAMLPLPEYLAKCTTAKPPRLGIFLNAECTGAPAARPG